MATVQMLQIPFPEFYHKVGITKIQDQNPIDSNNFLLKNLHIQRKNITFATELDMLNEIVQNTERFIASIPKEQRREYGQFFTAAESAIYMADMFDFDLTKPEMHILDAGAGTGLLTAAVLQRLIRLQYQGHLHIVCYETDPNVLPILMSNLDLMKTKADFSFLVIAQNYLTSQPFEQHPHTNAQQFDYIIGNPPYLKLPKKAPEALTMPQVCYGSPNLYFLFWAMGIYNLKEDGELVYIVPRSWTSGAYFERFRKYLFEHCSIQKMHLFVSRDKVFKQESVLQETMIIKVKKTTVLPQNILVSSSATADFNDLQQYYVPYNTIVAPNQYVFLVTNQEEAEVLQRMSKLTHTLPNLDLKMKTGIIVNFRTQEVLRNETQEGAYPLFYASHIQNGRVIWPVGKQGEYIVTDRIGFLQPNGNYLLVKRFTSKEEKRRLQCGMYRQKDYPQYAYISTDNKINYIACQSLCVLYGMYALLGSTLYDQYYRILNGSTQVNSTEVNTIPMPDRQTIEAMGNELMTMPINEDNCNKIVNKWIN